MNGKQNLVKLEIKFYVSGMCVNVKLNLATCWALAMSEYINSAICSETANL